MNKYCSWQLYDFSIKQSESTSKHDTDTSDQQQNAAAAGLMPTNRVSQSDGHRCADDRHGGAIGTGLF